MRIERHAFIHRFLLTGFAIFLATLSQNSLAKDTWRSRHNAQIELNLTAEQQTKLDKIEKEYSASLGDQRAAMSSARRSLESALQSSDSDDQIRKKFELLRVAEEQFAKTRFNKILEIRALLTPDQRIKFRGMNREGFEKRRHRNR